MILRLAMSLLSVSAVSIAAPSKQKMSVRLDKAGSFLSGSKVTKLKVEKTVTLELMGKTSSSTGEIFVGAGKFRWETEAPEKSSVVFDGKNLWTLQPPSAEFGGPTQVTKAKLDGKNKDQILVRVLSGGKLSSKFSVLDAVPEADGVKLNLEPIHKDPSVKNFSVILRGKPEKIEEIRYVDDVGNLTKIRVLSSSTVKKPAAGLFRFDVPKDAEVNEL